jgi:hypothetical protein
MSSDNKSYQSDVTLTSMKRAVKKAKSDSKAYPMDSTDPYPYGLSISLDNESLEKLGIDLSNYSVGDEVEIHGCAKVKELRQSDTERSGKDRNMTLQLTDLCVEGSDDAEDDEE